VEIRETVGLVGSGKGWAVGKDTETLHLGIVGEGELISDAAVFEVPLLHPWSVVSRTDVTLYSIPSEEFTRRIRADVLANIRRLSYAKKAFRDELRGKAHQATKMGHLESPRIRQAHKLLAQISSGPAKSSPRASAPAAASKKAAQSEAGIIMPRAIRATVMKNVVSGARGAAEVEISSRHVDPVDEDSRPKTAASSSHPLSSSPVSDEKQQHLVSPRFRPAPPAAARSMDTSRPFTSPVVSSAAAQPLAKHMRFDFSATAELAEEHSPVRSQTAEAAATPSSIAPPSSENKIPFPPPSPGKGSLLTQRNPFAYDHSNFISPLSPERVASMNMKTMDLVQMLTSPVRAGSLSPKKTPRQLESIVSNSPREAYPFDHIHLSEGVDASIDVKIPSVEAPAGSHRPSSPSQRVSEPNSPTFATPSHHRKRSRQPSISMTLGPGGSLSVAMPDGGVHTIDENCLVPAVPTTSSPALRPHHHVDHHRRPSTQSPAILQSQIRGHSRNVSSHRGSVFSASALPFALDLTPETIAEEKPLSAAAAQISAPVVILPAAPDTASEAIVSAGLQMNEHVVPVPSFSHQSPTFFAGQIPAKQFYGKISRRPSAIVTQLQGNPGERASVAASSVASGQVSSNGTAAFKRASVAPMQSNGISPELLALHGGGGAGAMLRQRADRTPRMSISARSDPTAAHGAIAALSTDASQSSILEDVSSEGSSASTSGRTSVHSSATVLLPVREVEVASTEDHMTVPPVAHRTSSFVATRTAAHSAPITTVLTAPPTTIFASVGSEDDENGEDSLGVDRGKTGEPRKRSKNATLLERTAAALVLDPLLLQRETRKWERQLTHWHRKLVVASTAFLTKNGKPLDEQPPQSTDASLLGGSQPPILTPESVDVFTTRSPSDLTPAQLACPLTLLSRTLPPPIRSTAIPYLYPTKRETGSMTETRTLSTVLTQLQDGVASGWKVTQLTQKEKAALDLEQRELTKRKLEEELALKRLVLRMKPEDELIHRRHYIPREIRAKSSSKQAQRRARLQEQVNGPEENESSRRRRENMDAGGDSDTDASKRRRKGTDIGKRSREERFAEKAAKEAFLEEKRREKLEKKRQEAETRAIEAEVRAERKRQEDEARALEAELRSAQGDSTRLLDLENDRFNPDQVARSGQQTPNALVSKSISDPASLAVSVPNLHHAAPSPGTPDIDEHSGYSALQRFSEAGTPTFSSSPSPKHFSNLRKPGSPTRAPSHHRSVTLAADVNFGETRSSRSPVRMGGSAHFTAAQTAAILPPEGPDTPRRANTAGAKEEASSLGLRLETTTAHATIGPRMTYDQRLLHTGTIELERDRELEFGREWAFFLDKEQKETARGQTFERILALAGGDALAVQRMLKSVQASAVDLRPHTARTDGVDASNRNKILAALERQRRLEDSSPSTTTSSVKHLALSNTAANLDQSQAALIAKIQLAEARQLEYEEAAQREQQSEKERRVTALTKSGDATVLGSSAPRLYHWSAIVHGIASPSSSRASGRPNSTAAADQLEMSELLTEEGLSQAMQRSDPEPPAAPMAKKQRMETLAELNSEIALYRRDLRVLRKEGNLATVANHSGDVNQRTAGLHSQASRAQQLARKYQRDMLGSTASPMAKILKLKKYDRSELYPSGSQTDRPRTSAGRKEDVAAAAAAALIDPDLDGVRRFWRQSFHKSSAFTRAGLMEHAQRILPVVKHEGASSAYTWANKEAEREEKQSTTVSSSSITPALSHSPSAAPATNGGTLLSQLLASKEAPLAERSAAESLLPTLTPPEPVGLLSFTPALSAILARSQPPAVSVFEAAKEKESPLQEFYTLLANKSKRKNIFNTVRSEE
jgi:hypothetical protein